MIQPGSDVKLNIEKWMETPGHDIMIVAGGLMCYHLDGDDIWTGAAWVHPDARRQGIMTAIIRKIIWKHHDKKYLKSLTNPDLEGVTKMYLKMGRFQPREEPAGLLWVDKISDLARRLIFYD